MQLRITRYHFLSIFALLLTGCGVAKDTSVENTKPLEKSEPLKVVTVGDSLTEGYGLHNPAQESYPAQLEQKLKQDGFSVTIENAGVSGETSTGGLARAEWIAESKPDLILLFLGANDMLRGITPSVTAKNIAQIVDAFQAKKIPVLLLPMKAQQSLGQNYRQQFDGLYAQIAQEKNIPITPFPLEGIAFVTSLNQADGIHPTPEGYAKLVENIYTDVISVLKSLPK